MRPLRYVAPALLLAAFLQASPARANLIGQIDTFEDGTTQGWVVGVVFNPPHPAPPTNIPTGGPGGAGDAFLQLTAVGGQNVPGNRLSVLNLSQWAGNYTAEGVVAIRMDVNNFGPDPLALRLLFEDLGPMGPTSTAFSTTPVIVPAGSGWVSVTFPVTPDDLTAGVGSVEEALANADVLRIFHSPTPTFPGPPVVAVLGVDNIQAFGAPQVPEPGSAALLGGLLGLAACRVALRRQRRA
jgi:hypothetical protein